MRLNKFAFIISLCFVLSIFGCSQKSSSPSHISLNFDWQTATQKAQDISSMAFTPSVTNLQRVMISVTASDFGQVAPPAWNRQSPSDVPPATFDASVPRGSARLVQVLLVFQDITTGSMIFYYGDGKTDTNADDVSVSILATPAGVGTGQGQIAGRYLSTPTTGPTGQLAMRYNPGSGKQTMTVDITDVYAGWFSVFSLQSQSFDYTFEDSSFLMQNVTTMNIPVSGSAVLRAYIPAFFTCHGSASCTTRQVQQNSRYVLGWFGPGASGKIMCYDASTGKNLQGLYADAASAILRQWNGSSPVVADDGTGRAGVELAGVAVASYPNATCGATQFSDHLYFDSKNASRNNAPLGFSGPFKPLANGSLFSTAFSGGTYNITWDYLPDVTTVQGPVSKSVLGVSLFYKILAAGNTNDDHDLNCNNVASYGYTLVQDFPNSVKTAALTAAQVGQTAATFQTATSNGSLKLLFCPYFSTTAQPRYFSKAVGIYGGGGGGPASGLAVFGPDGLPNSSVFNNNCVPAMVNGTSWTGSPGYFPTGTNLAFSAPADISFYSDPGCFTALTTPIAVSNNNSSYPFYFVTTGTAPEAITVTASGGLSASGVLNLTDANSISANFVQVLAPSTNIYAYQCVPLLLQSYYNNAGVNISSGITPASQSFTLSVAGGLQLYSDNNCNMPNASGTMFLGGSMAIHAAERVGGSFRYTGTSSSLPVTFTSSFSGTISPASFLVTQPGAPSALTFQGGQSFPAQNCQNLNVQLVDSNGQATPATVGTGTVSVAVTVPSGALYTTCASSSGSGYLGPSASFNIAVGSTSANFAYVPSVVGTVTISGTVATPSLSGTASYTVGPAVATQLAVQLPGQTFTAGTGVSGPAPYVLSGQPFSITAYALKNDMTIDTAYTGTANIAGTLFNLSGGAAASTGTIYGIGLQSVIPSTSLTPLSEPIILVPQATQLQIVGISGFKVGNCQAFGILMTDSGVSAAWNSSVVSGSMSTGGTGHLYSDSACTTGNAVSIPFSIPPGQSTTVVYYKSATAISENLTVTNSAGLLNTSAFSVAPAAGATAAIGNLAMFYGFGAFHRDICQPLFIFTEDSLTNGTVPPGAGSAVTFTDTSATGHFYSDNACSSLISGSFPLSSSQTVTMVYYKTSSLVASQLLQVSPAAGSLSGGPGNLGLNTQ